MSREHHFEDVVGGGRGPTAAERSSWVFGVLGVGLRCAEMCSGRLWVRWWLRSTSVRAISLKVGWMTRQEPLQLRLRPLVRLPIARRFIVGQPTLSFTIAARLLKAPVSTSRRISLQISMLLCTPVPLSERGCDRGCRPDHTPFQRTVQLCAAIFDRRDTVPAPPSAPRPGSRGVPTHKSCTASGPRCDR